MKKHLLLFILLTQLSFACNQDKNDPVANLIGSWELVEVISSWPVEVDQDFTEKYLFNTDGTFSKTSTRTGTGISVQAMGKYEILDFNEYDHLVTITLDFESSPELAVSCGSGMELLHISKENLLKNTSSMPCDGPGYVFRKI
jgi:hypothetical protein